MTTRNRELAGIIDDSGNITATGNLTVAGNLAQQSSTTTTYADNLLELNTGAGSNSNDLGFVFERGSTGDNAILIWDESNDGFIVGTTSSTGSATGNITVTAGDFAAGKITVDSVLINGTTIGHTSDTDLLTLADGVLTVAGEISVTTLDIGGTNVTSTAAELNILDGVNSTAAELNILDGVTATAAEINFLDGDTSATGTTLAAADRVIVNDGGTMKQVALSDFETFFESEIDTFSTIDINGGSIDGATVGANSASSGAFTTLSASGALTGTLGTAAQTNITSLGTLTALTVDNVIINGTTIGHTGDTDLMTLTSGVLTVAGELDAVSLDISGDADIDGTLEADAITIDGVTLSETIADTVGAMVGSNTESGITVAYQDGDNTLDFTVGTLNQDTTGTAATVTTAAQTNITSLGTLTALTVDNLGINGNTITANSGAVNITPAGGSAIVLDGTINVDAGVVTGATSITSTAFVGGLTGNVTGNTSGTALTVTQAAQTAITSLGTLTALTVDDITINGSTISDAGALTIDAEGDITLDANGGDWRLKDGGTTIVTMSNVSGDFYLKNNTTDKDIKFYGDDNGSEVLALTLDMSDAGTATFNHDIKFASDAGGDIGATSGNRPNNIVLAGGLSVNAALGGAGTITTGGAVTVGGTLGVTGVISPTTHIDMPDSAKIKLGTSDDLQLYHDGSNSYIEDAGTGNLYIKSNADNYINLISAASDANLGFTMRNSSGTQKGYLLFDSDDFVWTWGNTAERLRIASAGQLGIGGANYGTDGQILTSTGASSAPAWEDAPSSGIGKGVAMILAGLTG